MDSDRPLPTGCGHDEQRGTAERPHQLRPAPAAAAAPAPPGRAFPGRAVRLPAGSAPARAG
ncbi:hypothetical protein CWI85_13200, partial [Streptomyces albidoflavus]